GRLVGAAGGGGGADRGRAIGRRPEARARASATSPRRRSGATRPRMAVGPPGSGWGPRAIGPQARSQPLGGGLGGLAGRDRPGLDFGKAAEPGRLAVGEFPGRVRAWTSENVASRSTRPARWSIDPRRAR